MVRVVVKDRLELSTSRLSGVRSNQLNYSTMCALPITSPNLIFLITRAHFYPTCHRTPVRHVSFLVFTNEDIALLRFPPYGWAFSRIYNRFTRLCPLFS